MTINVLLIEDDPDVTETIISVLQNFIEDVEIENIIDGKGFRQGLWRNKEWALVVLDIMMPGITGFEVCEQIRHFPGTKNVPILALTGYDTVQNENRIMASGASRYLAKPFEINDFLRETKALLKG